MLGVLREGGGVATGKAGLGQDRGTSLAKQFMAVGRRGIKISRPSHEGKHESTAL